MALVMCPCSGCGDETCFALEGCNGDDFGGAAVQVLDASGAVVAACEVPRTSGLDLGCCVRGLPPGDYTALASAAGYDAGSAAFTVDSPPTFREVVVPLRVPDGKECGNTCCAATHPTDPYPDRATLALNWAPGSDWGAYIGPLTIPMTRIAEDMYEGCVPITVDYAHGANAVTGPPPCCDFVREVIRCRPAASVDTYLLVRAQCSQVGWFLRGYAPGCPCVTAGTSGPRDINLNFVARACPAGGLDAEIAAAEGQCWGPGNFPYLTGKSGAHGSGDGSGDCNPINVHFLNDDGSLFGSLVA